MYKRLNDIYNVIEELKNNSSSLKKNEIMTNFKKSLSVDDLEYVSKLLNYVFDSNIKFGVTSEKANEFNVILDNSEILDFVTNSVKSENIFVILDKLATRIYTGHSALYLVKKTHDMLCELCYENVAKLFYCIIDKDLKCGVSVSSISKVFGSGDKTNEFKDFGVALANKYFDRVDKVDFEKDVYYCSRKLDGTRLIVIKKGNEVKTYSRQCKEFTTLQVLKDVLQKIDGDFVLDGECCIVDENGLENFTEIVSQIKRKDFTIENPTMLVFDILTLEELYGEVASPIFSKRYEKLKNFFVNNKEILKNNFRLVEQKKVENNEHMMEMFINGVSICWEGVMLRKDVSWEGKRTNNLLKVKAFKDTEYVVKDYILGDMQFVEEGRTVVLKDILSAVIIDHKGCDVKVGSGFSKQQRIDFAKNPSSIVGHTITVQYFEETKNKDGGFGLRFPVFKSLRDEII